MSQLYLNNKFNYFHTTSKPYIMSATIRSSSNIQKRTSKRKATRSDSHTLSEESESFESILGKRVTHETSAEQLRDEMEGCDNSNDQLSGGDSDLPEKRVRR